MFVTSCNMVPGAFCGAAGETGWLQSDDENCKLCSENCKLSHHRTSLLILTKIHLGSF